MFTGIIECIGFVDDILLDVENINLVIDSEISNQLKIDQSVSHNGICLTVVEVLENKHRVCAIPETISKTTIGNWVKGQSINLERGMMLNARLDGHLVQGHVDCVGQCINRIDQQDNWIFRFQFPENMAVYVIEKGSITLNGTSLTCFQVTQNTFDVSIIPYTYQNTTISDIRTGSLVNIEFDVIGKYINRRVELENNLP